MSFHFLFDLFISNQVNEIFDTAVDTHNIWQPVMLLLTVVVLLKGCEVGLLVWFIILNLRIFKGIVIVIFIFRCIIGLPISLEIVPILVWNNIIMAPYTIFLLKHRSTRSGTTDPSSLFKIHPNSWMRLFHCSEGFIGKEPLTMLSFMVFQVGAPAASLDPIRLGDVDKTG